MGHWPVLMPALAIPAKARTISDFCMVSGSESDCYLIIISFLIIAGLLYSWTYYVRISFSIKTLISSYLSEI